AHQAAQDADIEVGPSQKKSSTLTSLPSSAGNMDEGVSIVDTPAQASVGGAIKVEPPTEDRVSDTPQSVIDGESLDETITIKAEGPLSTVQEEAALEEKAVPPTTTTLSSTPVAVIQDEPSRMKLRVWILDHKAPSAIRLAVEGAQHLLAKGLIEWRQVAFGVTFQVVDIQDGPLVIQNYHAEDADGDLLITDHEAGLLDREFVLRLRMSGLRGLRSPRASPISGPDPKRPQHVPPRPVSLSTPSLSSQPSYHSSDTNSQSAVTLSSTMSSIQNVSSRAGSDFVRSLFGTSGGSIESTRSGTSGSKVVQDDSSSLSVWSLGQPAAGHMPFRLYAPMVMTAQGGAVQANTHMIRQMVQTILPPPPVMAELDDVVMAESGAVNIQSERRSRHSRARRPHRRKDHSSNGSSSGSESEASRSRRKDARVIGHPGRRRAVGRIQSVPVDRVDPPCLGRPQSH
ncbi:hypothetical protein PHMEG_00033448, partial [Phytophthora megakarya]